MGDTAVLTMEGWFDAVLHGASMAMEAAGVAVIAVGALVALAGSLGSFRTSNEPDLYHRFRQRLGRSILIGLELLVAADIIGTVAVEPTLENVLILALIVLIRTFLSVSLSVEIEGRWPWQGATSEESKEYAHDGDRG